MERHPVPQNIMDVEFKLFCSLTIKQFGYLAAGVIIALIIYFTGLPELVKFILVAFSVIMGLFLALIRINGQPSATYVSNFIAALFNSQSRIWKKDAQVPEILKERKAPLQKVEDELIKDIKKNPSRTAAIPLQNLARESIETPWDKQEAERLKQIEAHFDFALKNLPPANLTSAQKKPGEFTPQKTSVANQSTVISNNDNLAGNNTKQPQGDPIYITKKFSTVFNPLKASVNRPLGQSAPATEKSDTTDNIQTEKTPTETFTSSYAEKVAESAGNQHFIQGIIRDTEGKSLAKITVYIKNSKEELLRKTVSNSQGKFFITNPLGDGLYYIDLQGSNYNFDRQTINLTPASNNEFIFTAL